MDNKTKENMEKISQCFPYKFQKDFPLICPQELTFKQFVELSYFDTCDYHFDNINLALTQQAYRVDLRFAKLGHPLTGVKLLAYHLRFKYSTYIHKRIYISSRRIIRYKRRQCKSLTKTFF